MYSTPGLSVLATAPNIAGWRGLWLATNGSIYGVCGSVVYLLTPGFTLKPLGSLATAATTPVGMCDNGSVLVIVDGTGAGYAINISPLLVGAPLGATLSSPGTGYVNGVYLNFPLTGGSGVGATATIVVTNGQIASFTFDPTGQNYVVGDTLSAGIPGGAGFALLLTSVETTAPNAFAPITDPNFLGATRVDYVDTFFLFNEPGTNSWYASLSAITYADLTGTQGAIQGGDIAVPGAGYVNGTYVNVPLTGGNGFGGKGTVTVAGGAVVAFVLTAPGVGYSVGDPLGVAPVNVGGTGSGFSWVVSVVQASAFDPTYVAQKTGFPDWISTLIVMHREIWLLGTQRTSEVWYNAGNAGFPFAIAPGVYVEHGCIAPYSVAKHDLNIFWLGADKDGRATVYIGANYAARPISTPAIAAIFSTYGAVADAIGMTYKQQDHVFYVLTFPSANATWVYDLTENLWHQRTWTDPNGGENRVRWQALAYAGPNYGDVILAGDWQTGQLYSLDLNAESDNGAAIVRRRTFEHIVADGVQLIYPGFRLDCEVGDFPPPASITFYLRWSDDRGRTFGNPIGQIATAGDYLFQPKWSNLGRARDRVFEVFWSDPYVSALSGAWLDPEPKKTGA